MKSSISKWFKNCTDVEKSEINAIIRKEEFERRDHYYPSGAEESKLPWYFKTDYINNFSLADNNLEEFCPECKKTERASELIKETGFEQRTITVKCPCGCVYQFGD